MTNNQYIVALKKALGGLDKTSRNDIILEIKSHAEESGSPLIERFGSAEELAKQYLDGEKIAQPIATKIWGMSKSFFKILAISVLALILLIAIISYFATKDKFNYADENAAELSTSNNQWQTQEWTSNLDLNIDQSSVAIYWHDDKNIRWSCDGTGPVKNGDSGFLVRQSQCLLFLPKVATTLNADQAQVVLVRPQVSLDITARQASVKVAENGIKYKYHFESDRTKLSGLQSFDDAEHTIFLKTKEAMISSYNY